MSARNAYFIERCEEDDNVEEETAVEDETTEQGKPNEARFSSVLIRNERYANEVSEKC